MVHHRPRLLPELRQAKEHCSAAGKPRTGRRAASGELATPAACKAQEAASNRGLFLSPQQRRTASIAALVACAASLLLVVVWSALNVAGFVNPSYTLQISIVAQAPSAQRSLSASRDARHEIETAIGFTLHGTVTQLRAIAANGAQTRNWLTLAHYTVHARSLNRLAYINRVLKRRSPWPVTDISGRGEFVQVPVRRGVTTLRLAETIGTADAATHVRLQTSGPDVAFTAADMLPICLVVLLVLGFGAVERNPNDVHAFPRGMHPIVISTQVLTLALFACFLVTYARTGVTASGAGLLVLDGAVALSAGRWFAIAKAYWSASARIAFCATAAALVIAGVLLVTFCRCGG